MLLTVISKLGKKFTNDILKFFEFFPENKIWHFKQFCMKYQILFFGKNKKNIIKLSSAEFAHSVYSINYLITYICLGEIHMLLVFEHHHQLTLVIKIWP